MASGQPDLVIDRAVLLCIDSSFILTRWLAATRLTLMHNVHLACSTATHWFGLLYALVYSKINCLVNVFWENCVFLFPSLFLEHSCQIKNSYYVIKNWWHLPQNSRTITWTSETWITQVQKIETLLCHWELAEATTYGMYATFCIHKITLSFFN